MLTRRLILSVLAGSAFKGINFASGGIVKNSKPYAVTSIAVPPLPAARRIATTAAS